MKSEIKKERNEEALALHLLDKKKYSASFLARKYGMTRQAMHEILLREMARMGDKEAKKTKTVKNKYPGMV